MQGMDPPSNRTLLAALNARADLSRAAVCRLGADLALWKEATTADPTLARRLSMDLDTLSEALAMRSGAAALANAAERRARQLGAALCTLADDDFPPALRELALPPPAVHIAGDVESTAAPAVAIVGSRRASPYGIEVATWLGQELARSGLVVVSGFARGVDAAAHRGALRAVGGRTVAVLGCGLAYDYPSGQRPLAQEIRGRGALLSEFPCDAAPQTWHFPVRNRIIAALSRATIVVEATLRSGSLITARLALEMGREVLAVPGRITDELALGTNELLRDGAVPVTHPGDVLDALDFGAAARPAGTRPAVEARPVPRGLAPLQAALFAALDAVDGRPPEALAECAGCAVDGALGALLDLELAGHAVRMPGGLYRRR